MNFNVVGRENPPQNGWHEVPPQYGWHEMPPQYGWLNTPGTPPMRQIGNESNHEQSYPAMRQIGNKHNLEHPNVGQLGCTLPIPQSVLPESHHMPPQIGPQPLQFSIRPGPHKLQPNCGLRGYTLNQHSRNATPDQHFPLQHRSQHMPAFQRPASSRAPRFILQAGQHYKDQPKCGPMSYTPNLNPRRGMPDRHMPSQYRPHHMSAFQWPAPPRAPHCALQPGPLQKLQPKDGPLRYELNMHSQNFLQNQQMPPQYGRQMPPQCDQQKPPQYDQQMPPQHGQQMPPQYDQLISPQCGQQIPPQCGQQIPPQCGQQMPPEYDQQMPPQYDQQMPPQHGQQMPPQHGQQIPPQCGQQMPPQYDQLMPPQHGQQMPPEYDQQMPPQYDRQMPPAFDQQMPPQYDQLMPLQYHHRSTQDFHWRVPHQISQYGLLRRPHSVQLKGGRIGYNPNGRKPAQYKKQHICRPSANELVQNPNQGLHKMQLKKVHSCETCERDFKSADMLAAHIAQHQACSYEGCTFTAHPKIIKQHIQLQHLTGLFERFPKTYSPEEIAHWRSERKRLYPTQARLVKDKACKMEMLKRGERMPHDNKFRFNITRKVSTAEARSDNSVYKYAPRRDTDVRRHEQRRRAKQQNDLIKSAEPFTQKADCSTLQVDDDPEEDAWRGKLPRFPGTAAFPITSDGDMTLKSDAEFSDVEWDKDADKTCGNNAHMSVVNNALAVLAAYESDTEDEGLKVHKPKKADDVRMDVENGPFDLTPKACSLVDNDCSQQQDKTQTVIMTSIEPEVAPVEYKEAIADLSIQHERTMGSVIASKLILDSRHKGYEETRANHQIQCEETINFENAAEEDSDSGPEEAPIEYKEDLADLRIHPGAAPCGMIATKQGSDSGLKETLLQYKETMVDPLVPLKKNPQQRNIVGSELKKITRVENKKEPFLPQKTPAQKLRSSYTRRSVPTLLEKLLSSEIRRERNTILQCVRYVVLNHFFGVDNTKC